jgi:four helix bundle protein
MSWKLPGVGAGRRNRSRVDKCRPGSLPAHETLRDSAGGRPQAAHKAVRTGRDSLCPIAACAGRSGTIGRQLLRSGTGVAANYRSACRARSRAEFVARLSVALEESDESALWLEVLTDLVISRTAEALRLLQQSHELSAIFAQSCLTARANLQRE